MILTYIRSNIKRLRRSKGITQREMALRLFMDERTYAKVERGANKSMDVRLLSAVAEILQTDVADLMREPDNDEKSSGQESPLTEAGQQELLEEVRQLKEEVRALIDFQKKALHLLAQGRPKPQPKE